MTGPCEAGPRNQMNRTFASDNYAGCHPEILEAIGRANTGHDRAYGEDACTLRARESFEKAFGAGSEAFFVFNGTAANVLAIQALLKPHEAVICAESAHLNQDECGAPERYLGCKLMTVAASDGKVRPDDIRSRLGGRRDQHKVQPRVVSVGQATEQGSVYSPDEVRALSAVCRAEGLLLHMDGARLANAAAALGKSLREVSRDCGVDALSFGGTKNGLLYGEAVVFFDPARAADFSFIRKQGMQLASKMRFISAQFEALLAGDLWLRSARHANAMARLLGERAAKVPGVRLARAVEANSVYALLPAAAIPKLQESFPFYVWVEPKGSHANEGTGEVRWMASWDTTEADVEAFIRELSRSLGSSA